MKTASQLLEGRDGTLWHARPDDTVFQALQLLAEYEVGALMVIERDTGLRDLVASGHRLDARLRYELLVAIFLPSSPMHDGGVIIHKGRIHSSGCLLPLSQNPHIEKRYGTRHRAALGLSEETDALIIVVSEETQEISVVRQGTITPFHDEEGLRAALTAICLPRPQTPRWRTLLNTLRPDHARKA